MSAPPQPPRGHMILYDRMDPPLPAGEYTLHVSTDVSLAGATLPADVRHFNVEGPRFTLAPTEVAGVYPPRNARGAFVDALPQVTLGRRTLPWERTADPAGALPLPPVFDVGAPPRPEGAPPWLALLLFDETGVPEATVLTDQLLSDVLPATVRQGLVPPPPADARCDAVEVTAQLLKEILPTVEELHLLTHVRQVNVEDRELSAGDSDGWFSVVVANRVPQRNRKYRACLVSVEGRTDLLTTVVPPVAADFVIGPIFTDFAFEAAHDVARAEDRPAAVLDAAGGVVPGVADGAFTGVAGAFTEVDFLPNLGPFVGGVFQRRERLVLLHSWTFECAGTGSFQQLAETVDVGLIGEVRGDFPKVADTGHLPVELRDRAGALQTVWYRGPLVPFPVTRDARGPYHSADQARRVSPETGLEDISYAAAFEVGRLLAAADGRLAQELMRWRRGDFRRAVELTLQELVSVRFPSLVDRLSLDAVASVLVDRWSDPRVKVFDAHELATVAGAPGLDATRLAAAWNLPVDRARELLSPQLVAFAPPLEAGLPAIAAPGTLDTAARDLPALGRLANARERVIDAALRLQPNRGGRG
jgi:hypothetical protein